MGPRAGLDVRLVEWTGTGTVFEEHLEGTGSRKMRTLFELRNLNLRDSFVQ